ncbi:MAG TPA: c-type cytochrome biogenesis protein CcmI [Usitatibacter sp.]|jgi:cytochrome c-type biogenesis protein CcmH|nr:c-type cytochrome biogenesis protein CcmI [Usitatibacter sp.]
MTVFVAVAALMTLVALAFVLVPLLRARRGAPGPGVAEANLEVLRSQRREIEADASRGLLDAAGRDAALAELAERARGELALPAEAPVAASSSRKPWATAAIVAIALPAFAIGLYLAFGAPDSLAPHSAAAKMDDAQIVAMVENLARKVRERPDDARGWALLARSMAALGRFDESADAYEHLASLVPGDAQVLADYADALGMAHGRSLAGKPYELAKQALAIEPTNHKALALAGTAAMDGGDLAAAAGYWRALAAQLEPGSDDERQVLAVLDEIGAKAASAGRPLAPATALAKAAPPAASPGARVSGSVRIAPALAAKAAPGDTLFVFARAEGGSRMPLAVIRSTASSLPLAYSLDDSMAMSPMAKISAAPAVRIEARVSRSGGAAPQPGDLVGASGVVKPGAAGVDILIDKVLP